MAADSWLPHQFRHLSTRLVTQNGIVIMGLAALVILLWSGGKVDLLVVLYSINVFLTFSLSLLGLCIYWWRKRKPTALELSAGPFGARPGGDVGHSRGDDGREIRRRRVGDRA